ncbi:ASB8 protein, partial [Mionectes macconnelli]|nr:ASB8 protein [Mionectes macconnelli]
DVNCLHGTLKPLHCACMVADADCVELLLQKGAEVNALDGYSRTALHYAAERDEACVELLLEFGADPSAADGNRDTPLHWAAFRNHAGCVRALLEGGARVDARDHHADTPLGWAASRANLESVAVLLDFGAEPRALNLDGQSPAQRLVARRGPGSEREESCLELLLRAGGRLEMREMREQRELRELRLGERLARLCAQPGSLQGLARCAVRRSLGRCFLPDAVEQLPLPASLKGYLLLLS